ncbi:MAG: ABC transporter ATP-binding protein/permease [Deltaproteobacteria bacterium]|nr:ABC transporter ATP-binding protein/permease [Kofleriaceae bacterium]
MSEPHAAGTKGAWGYLTRYQPAIVGGVAMLVLTNLLFVGIPVTTGMTVSALQEGRHGDVPALALWMVVFAAGTAITRILSRVWIFNAARAAEYDLRGDLFRHLLRLDLPWYRAHPTGDVMSRLTNDVQTVRAMWGAGILNVINTLVAFVTVLAMMVRVDPWLTLWACLPYPTIAVLGQMFGKRVYKTSREVQAQLGALSNEIQEDLTSIQAIKSYGLEGIRKERFRASSQKLLEKNMALTRVRGQLGPAFGALGALSSIVVLWVGGRSVMRGDIELGQLVEMSGYLARLVWPTLALGWMLSLLQRGRASWNRLETLFAERPTITDGDGGRLEARDLRGGIEVRDLKVALGGRPILDGVSFAVPAGTTTAIVGRTGSGKSTLVEAICRLIDIPPGTVFLDGRDVTSLSLRDLRQAIGYAPQEAFLFSTTIADNVAFGYGAGSSIPRARAEELERVTGALAPQLGIPAFTEGAPDPRITAAAEAAGLTRDLAAMPDHYATVVGERGITLSGGQRQRVALARAIASDPRLLILDDSLSSVDAETEQVILERLQKVLAGRTALLISHRVAAVKNAHQIVVLDEGKVVEAGTHAQLLAKGGLYAELYRTQLAAQTAGLPAEAAS